MEMRVDCAASSWCGGLCTSYSVAGEAAPNRLRRGGLGRSSPGRWYNSHSQTFVPVINLEDWSGTAAYQASSICDILFCVTFLPILSLVHPNTFTLTNSNVAHFLCLKKDRRPVSTRYKTLYTWKLTKIFHYRSIHVSRRKCAPVFEHIMPKEGSPNSLRATDSVSE